MNKNVKIAKNLWEFGNKNFSSQSAFARELDMAPQNLAKYTDSEDPKNLGPSMREKIRLRFGQKVLDSILGVSEFTVAEQSIEYKVREYPVAGKIQAGKGAVTFEYDRVEPGPPGVLVKEGYWFVVKGDSMEPRYFSGEMVFVRKDVEPQHGDFAVIVWDDFTEGCIKQIFYQDKIVVLKSLNSKYEPVIIPKSEIVFVAKITHSKSK